MLVEARSFQRKNATKVTQYNVRWSCMPAKRTLQKSRYMLVEARSFQQQKPPQKSHSTMSVGARCLQREHYKSHNTCFLLKLDLFKKKNATKVTVQCPLELDARKENTTKVPLRAFVEARSFRKERHNSHSTCTVCIRSLQKRRPQKSFYTHLNFS